MVAGCYWGRASMRNLSETPVNLGRQNQHLFDSEKTRTQLGAMAGEKRTESRHFDGGQRKQNQCCQETTETWREDGQLEGNLPVGQVNFQPT